MSDQTQPTNHLDIEEQDMQLKARMEGIPTPVYGRQEVHHKA